MASSRPVDHGMTSFWRSQPHPLDNHRSTETLPDTTDIVIVGAGYAGTSTAYHCLQRSDSSRQKPSIVILEARQACSGATGRNGGHLKPDPYNRISLLARKHGPEAAEEVAAFEAKHVTAFQSFLEKENIECDFEVSRATDVYFDEQYLAQARDAYDFLIAAGAPTTKEASFIPQESAEKVSGVKGAQGGFSYTTARLWPYRFVTQLLERVLAAGVNLQTHTPVLQVSETTDLDGRWTVHTNRGSIRAKWVVFASNGYTSAIAKEYQDKIVPVRGVCSRIVVPNAPERPLVDSYMLRFKDWHYDYLIPRPDGSIIVGGARPTFYWDQSLWYNNTDDSRVIDPAVHYFDDYMQRYFLGWEKTGAYTDRVWTGIMGYTSDGSPHIGHVPDKPGQVMIAGFNGHGMPQVFLSAEGVARMIVEGMAYEETGLPRLFKTTSERLQT